MEPAARNFFSNATDLRPIRAISANLRTQSTVMETIIANGKDTNFDRSVDNYANIRSCCGVCGLLDGFGWSKTSSAASGKVFWDITTN